MSPMEIQNVGDIGTAPPVNGLVVVTNHAERIGTSRQQGNQLFLPRVNVLVLIDDNVLESVVRCAKRFRVRPEFADSFIDNPVEI